MAMFQHRTDAGRQLAETLVARPDLQDAAHVVVLGLPRGGVPVALEVARALGARMDVLVIRKLGVPIRPELAMGAVGEDNVTVVNDEVLGFAEVTQSQFDAEVAQQRKEVQERAERFRPGRRAPVPLDDQTAVIVDDGIATGATALAAGQLARARGATTVLLATPVAPYDVFEKLQAAEVFDDIICRYAPVRFRSVGAYYTDFMQVPDAQVRMIMEQYSAS